MNEDFWRVVGDEQKLNLPIRHNAVVCFVSTILMCLVGVLWLLSRGGCLP